MDTATNNCKYFAVYRDYLFAGIKFGKNPQRFGIHHILVYRNQNDIITCIVIEIIGAPAEPLYLLGSDGQSDYPVLLSLCIFGLPGQKVG